MIAGRISSTTLMANQRGFDEAIGLARAGGFTDRIGVHLNFSSGPPLSDLPQFLRSPLGELEIPVCRLSAPASWVRAVEAEMRAQVAKVVDAGIRPTHFDSHEHWHNSFPWTKAILRVAREFGISRVRPARNCFYQRSFQKTTFKSLFNAYLALSGVRGVKRFTDIKPWFEHVSRGGEVPDGPMEIMCHPAAKLADTARHWEIESDLLLSGEMGECLKKVCVVPYSDL